MINVPASTRAEAEFCNFPCVAARWADKASQPHLSQVPSKRAVEVKMVLTPRSQRMQDFKLGTANKVHGSELTNTTDHVLQHGPALCVDNAQDFSDLRLATLRGA